MSKGAVCLREMKERLSLYISGGVKCTVIYFFKAFAKHVRSEPTRESISSRAEPSMLDKFGPTVRKRGGHNSCELNDELYSSEPGAKKKRNKRGKSNESISEEPETIPLRCAPTLMAKQFFPDASAFCPFLSLAHSFTLSIAPAIQIHVHFRGKSASDIFPALRFNSG